MEMHFATVWEAIADTIGDAVAVRNGDSARTWSAYDDRAARLASAFSAAGIGADAKIGLYLYNGNEYLESQFAGFKVRGVPVNVNYRYLDEELRYLLDNADAEAIVFHSSLGDRVDRVRDRLPKLKLLVEVDDGGAHLDGAERYEDLMAAHAPAPRIARDEADIYIVYTGGTTGLPKGVMYAMGGITSSAITGGYPLFGLTPPSDARGVATVARDQFAAGRLPVFLPTCPLMHGTGMVFGVFVPHMVGGQVVTLPSRSLDGHEVMRTVQERAVTSIVVVGDAMARPLVRAIDEAVDTGAPYDTSSLTLMMSSGVMWTAEVKDQILDRVPQLVLLDAIASTEGVTGVQITMKGLAAETAKFQGAPTTKVFTEDGRVVQPGSGEAGLLAAGGSVPLGYYKDAEKTARTFRVIDGQRYSFPGDWATVDADGSIRLLGRGSQCINTAGEKVYPEEVEEAVKRTPGIEDCLVVGLPDERYGEAVTAIVSRSTPGANVDEAIVVASVKGQLASYKAPKRVVFVDDVPRAPNGKADYAAAKRAALAALA